MGAIPVGKMLVYATRRASVLLNAVRKLLSRISYIGGITCNLITRELVYNFTAFGVSNTLPRGEHRGNLPRFVKGDNRHYSGRGYRFNVRFYYILQGFFIGRKV